MVARTAARTAVPMAVPTVVPTVVPIAVPIVVRTEVPMGAQTVARTEVPTAVPTAARTVAQAADLGSGTDGAVGPASSGPDRPALRRCTSLDPDAFAREVWGRSASLSRREDLPAGFADLFSLDAVDALVSRQGLRTPFLRVAKNGETLPPAGFTRGGGVGATVADQVADDQLARLFADGCTIVLQGVHRVWSPVVDFAQDLMADLGHPVQVNAYVTPPQSQGFGDHYDVHDVFVLQVAGEKRWMIHEPVRPAPLRDEPWGDRRAAVERAAVTEPLLDVTLRPGDALYLPRGYLHAAQALGETSAHLTVGIHPWTRSHLVEQLVAGVARPDTPAAEGLRTSLPLGVDVTDPSAIATELEATISALTAALADVRAADVARRLERQADGASRAAPVGPMAQARALAAVDLWTRLRWRPHLRARLATQTGPDGAQELVVRTPEATVRVPAAAREAVDRLLSGDVLIPAEIGALAGADGTPADGTLADGDRLEVARTLLREALVVPA